MKRVRQTFNILIALILILLGILGFVLPFIPGFILIAFSLIILSFEIPYLENLIMKHFPENTKIGEFYLKFKNKFEKYFK